MIPTPMSYGQRYPLAARDPKVYQANVLGMLREHPALFEQQAMEIVGILMLKFPEHTEVGRALVDAFIALDRKIDSMADEAEQERRAV